MTRDRNAVLDRVGRELAPDSDAFKRLQERRDGKEMRRRVAGGLVGGAITVAIIAGLLISSGTEPDQRSGSDRRWADVPAVPEQDQFYYVRFTWPGNGTVQLWIAADGSGRRVWKGGAGPKEVRFSSEEGTQEWLVPDLSTDPDEFLQQLVDRSGPGGASPVPIATTSPGRSQESTSVLRSMSDLLTFDSALMPGQVQALIGAAQQVDGVTIATDTVDPWGRPAISLSHVIDYPPGPGQDLIWYFDPETGQFLGEAWAAHGSGKIDAGTTVQLSGFVTDDHETPDPRDALVPPIP